MRKFVFSCLSLLLPLVASASGVVDPTPTADDGCVVVEVNGVEMVFKVMDAYKRTLQVGSGHPGAIPAGTAGPLVIPSEVTIGGNSYGVVRIADSAFVACSWLTSVEVPASITYAGNNAFRGCTGLQKVVVADLGAWCGITFANLYANPLSYAGHLYSDADTEITSLEIPPTVTKIGSFAFARSYVRQVAIPGSVKELGSSSFYKCAHLDSVHFDQGLERIKSNAFYECSSLTSVSLPDGMDYMGSSAFYSCTALKSVELPASLTGSYPYTGIGSYAFKGCGSLASVTSHILWPASVLGREAFASIDPGCVLHIPMAKLTEYVNAGWTESLFPGGIVEMGEPVANLSIENAVTSLFIDSVAYPDDDYSVSRIAEYTAMDTDYRKDLPWPVRIVVDTTACQGGEGAGALMVLETYDGGRLARCDTFIVGQRALEIWNLIPQKDYIYRLCRLGDTGSKELLDSGAFRTQGQVRMMRIADMRNFRDLGGWALPHGRHVEYDRLFRSAELAHSRRFITDAGLHEMTGVQGIGVEIDFGDFSDVSPAQQLLEFVHGDDYQLMPYGGGIVSTPAQYKNCFDKVVQSLQEGKKVLFHCSEGADRTGTFAFMLEGLLGVSESDMAKDYELTDFYMDSRSDDKRYRNNFYKSFVEHVKNNYPGSTIHEKIEQMALAMGIAQERIDSFRCLMTGGDFAPGADTLAAARCHAVAGQKAVLPIVLSNEDVAARCEFSLRLPTGVSLATKSNGKFDVRLADRADNYSVRSKLMENGDYHFVVASVDEEDTFLGHGGNLVELTIEVADSIAGASGTSGTSGASGASGTSGTSGASGVRELCVVVVGAELTVADGRGQAVVKLADAASVLTVSGPAPMPGDVNGDGAVTIADVECVVGYITGKVAGGPDGSPVFNVEAADANADGIVTVADAGIILSLALSSQANSQL